MDSDEGKLFIGGIACDTTEETLTDHFTKYGVVSQTLIMRDTTTGRPRGFGFVVFADPSVLDSVLRDRHTIEGRLVEAKRALSREEQQTSRPGNNFGKSSGGTGNYRTKKIFVGGLPSTLTDEQFREYFENYGAVTEVVIMCDQNRNRPRGFGFISFDTEDAVDRVLQKTFHELNNKLVEVKQALPKDANPGSSGRGGGYQGNNAGFDSRMDGHRFMHQQATGGGYLYSSYGQPSYGYGGYASYGVGGYGGAAGAYGNPSGLKVQWGGQSLGYGGAGYGPNVGYGVWNAAGGGPAVSGQMGQSASGAAGYGGQTYGYGNYGHDCYNSKVGGYGAGGGRFGPGDAPSGDQQGAGSGYNGQTGYSNEPWRSES